MPGNLVDAVFVHNECLPFHFFVKLCSFTAHRASANGRCSCCFEPQRNIFFWAPALPYMHSWYKRHFYCHLYARYDCICLVMIGDLHLHVSLVSPAHANSATPTCLVAISHVSGLVMHPPEVQRTYSKSDGSALGWASRITATFYPILSGD